MKAQRMAIMKRISRKKMSVTQSVTITTGGFVLSMLSLEITIHIILLQRQGQSQSSEKAVPHLILVNLG